MFFSVALCLLSCDPAPPPEHRRYTESLRAVTARPGQTGAICGALQTQSLREDCVLTGVELLVEEDVDAAAALCADLPAGLSRDECGFVLAEQTGEAARCEQAGRFAIDCRMHLLHRTVTSAALPADPVELESPAQAVLAAGGFAADDEHAWTLLYRDALARQAPLDLPRCDDTPRPMLCRRAGLGLFNDRLNYARDTSAITAQWCQDRSGVALLSHVADPELDALIASRMDVCQ